MRQQGDVQCKPSSHERIEGKAVDGVEGTQHQSRTVVHAYLRIRDWRLPLPDTIEVRIVVHITDQRSDFHGVVEEGNRIIQGFHRDVNLVG